MEIRLLRKYNTFAALHENRAGEPWLAPTDSFFDGKRASQMSPLRILWWCVGEPPARPQAQLAGHRTHSQSVARRQQAEQKRGV